MRVLLVEQLAYPSKPRTTREKPGRALNHDPLDVRPVVAVEIHGHCDVRVPLDVLHLAPVVAGGEADLPIREHMTDGNEVRHTVLVHGGDPADALARDELSNLLLQAHEVPSLGKSKSSQAAQKGPDARRPFSAACYTASHPPSTTSSVPVMYEASSEARKSTA